MNQAVLLSTHFINDFVINSYHNLCLDLMHGYDVFLLINVNDSSKMSVPTGVQCYLCDLESVNSLGYNPIRENLLPGSCHFPLLRFALDYPQYDFYWFIEYDVYFTGNWSVLMDDCSSNLREYDFLSCQVERFNISRNLGWKWWYDSNNSGFVLAESIKGFNPICRYSRQAVTCLDAYLKNGYSAHSEVMITTCLYHSGLKIGDFGGNGEFVPEGYEGKYYTPKSPHADDGSIRYRPVFTLLEIVSRNQPCKIFHPLKPVS